nr:hypothetical protein [Tanacetum cinerariifolium]
MNEAVKVAVQLQSDRLRDEAQAENEDFLNKLDENIQKIIKEQVKVQVSKILPKIKKTVNEQLEAKVLTRASNSSKTSYDMKNPSAGSDRGSKRRRAGKEPESTSAPKEKTSKTSSKSTEGSKSHQKTASESALAKEPMHTTQDLEEPAHLEFKTGTTDVQPIAEASQHPEWFQKQTKPSTADPFLMNRLKVDTLTPELLAGPTYELMKGSCKSLVELEFFLEEVYKATTDQLDWNNPEGQQYPHNLLKPLPLIHNSRGRHVIPFDHFINNDLEYLSGGASSQKYTTSVTKTKAADYGHIKESARDVYSKRRIIAVTKLQIVEWHNYKYLDWITVCKDDGKLYKLKECDLKRLRIQDIKDKLLLLVQGKLTNLTVKERFVFNVSLRMFTRSGIRMKYLPQTIRRRSDKERAAAMIQSIDKQLKTRRIMRSLEKFVGGRLYEGDFRMLQQTI